jgi:hypothetical protein
MNGIGLLGAHFFNKSKVVAAIENALDCDSNMYALSPQADRRALQAFLLLWQSRLQSRRGAGIL